MNSKVIPLIKDTILKELRNKTLVFVVISTTFIVLLSNQILKLMMGTFQSGNGEFQMNGQSSLTVMISFINFWCLIIAGLFGTSSIRSDFNNNVIYQYLTFPISRVEYMWGRITGSFTIVFGYYLYSYVFAGILFSITTKSFAFTAVHFLSLFLMGIYILLIIFFSYLLSMYFNRLGAFLMLIGTVVAIYFSTSEFRNLELAQYFSNFGIFKLIGLALYIFLPRLGLITEMVSDVLNGTSFKFNLILELIHLIFSSSILIFLGTRMMKKKDF